MATHAPLPWDTTPGKDVVTSARTPERTEMRERESEREREKDVSIFLLWEYCSRPLAVCNPRRSRAKKIFYINPQGL